MASSTQGNKFKSKYAKIFSFIFLFLLLFFVQNIDFNQRIPNIEEAKSNQDYGQNYKKLKEANGESVIFQGTENLHNITDYGNLYDLNQEISIDNEAELNLTYDLDESNNWKVSKIENSISNIQDKREWVNNNSVEPITIFKVDDYRASGPYQNNEIKGDASTTTIIKSGATAMRVHFVNISFEDFGSPDNWHDYIFIEDENNVIYYQDTDFKEDYFSPWILGDTLQVYIESDNHALGAYDGYIIDYYEFMNSSSNTQINWYSWGSESDTRAAVRTIVGSGIMDNATAFYIGMHGQTDKPATEYRATYWIDDYNEIYQNISVPRGNLIDAYISFDYYPQFTMRGGNNFIYFAINGQEIYSKSLLEIVDLGRNQWHSTGNYYLSSWSNTSNVFDDILNGQDLNISLGIKSKSSTTYTGYEDRFQQVFWFDNISLVLTTTANSTQDGINLTINEDPLTEGGDWGDCSLELTDGWETDPITLTFNTTSPSLTFDFNTTLYGHRNTTSTYDRDYNEGVSYQIFDNGTVFWEFLHDFYEPSSYSDFEFVVEIPSNWRIISAKDRFGDSKPFEGGGIGDGYVKINKTYIFKDWWTFKATSPNFLNITNTKLLKNGQWVQTSFKSGESTKIKTQVNYSNEKPPNVDSTYVNLTIYDPGGSVWYENATKPFSNGTVFFPKITFDSSNTTGGYYNYTLFWTNGTSLGGIESNFIVNHNSSLILLKPDDAKQSLKTNGFWGDLIPLRVYLNDTERNLPISKAKVLFNWTGGTNISVEEAASGIYETIIYTGDLPGPGLYRIVVNSSKIGFFDSNLTLEISLNDVSNLQVIDSDYYIEFHGNGTIKLKFTQSDGQTGIPDATVKLNISDPQYYYINYTGNGIYVINFNSSFISSMGIYKLRVNFTADLCTPQFYIYHFQIIEQSVNLTVLINSQEIEENILIRATFNDAVRISVRSLAINDNDYLSGANITWIGEIYEVNLTESANLWYNESITCSSSSVSLGINYIYVQFKLDSYATTNFDFQLMIAQKTIDVIPIDFDDSIDAEPGEDITIEIRLKETGSDTNVDGAIVSYSWEYGVGTLDHKGNGIYELELEIPEDIEEDDYKVELVISISGSVYKSTEYSFIVDVEKEEEEGLNLIFWIVIAVLLGIISVLGVLSFRSYVYMPRKRRKESELLAKTQRFKDLDNIQAIVVIHRLSGIPVYMKSFGILETQKKELFSGFIQAITSIGAEISAQPAIIVEETEEMKSDKIEKLIEIDFKHFYCLIADKESVRLVIILKENASDRLKEQASLLSFAIQLKLRDLFEDWDGELNQFEKDIPPVISEYLELYYKGQFTLTKPYVLAKMREEHELNNMETRIVNVIRSFAKSKSEFYLNFIIQLVAEENKDFVIEGIESLIDRKIILPVET